MLLLLLRLHTLTCVFTNYQPIILVDLGENDGTTISLTVVDTPGFGDYINNNECCSKIVQYLEKQFDCILDEERRVQRNPKFEDNRVHVCLYFVSPTGHGLQELDIDLMMNLSARVNVIPVISKADTLTVEELSRNKQAIMDDIRRFKIPIYYFPCDMNDEESMEECSALKSMVPFSIVGSNSLYKIGDEFVRGRGYPWGFVKIEDPDFSDFVALRSVLFGSHLQELRDLTHEVLYEKYRTERLSENDQDYISVTNDDLLDDDGSSKDFLRVRDAGQMVPGRFTRKDHIMVSKRSFSADSDKKSSATK